VVRCAAVVQLALGCSLSVSPSMMFYTLIHFLEVLAAFSGIVAAFSYGKFIEK